MKKIEPSIPRIAPAKKATKTETVTLRHLAMALAEAHGVKKAQANTMLMPGFTPAVGTYLIEKTGNRAAPALWLSLAAAISLVAAVAARARAGDAPALSREPLASAIPASRM
jgi:hypothetical protein